MLGRKRADVNMLLGGGVDKSKWESTDTPDFFDDDSNDSNKKFGFTDGFSGSQGKKQEVDNNKQNNMNTKQGLENLLNSDPDIQYVESGLDASSVDFGVSSDH